MELLKEKYHFFNHPYFGYFFVAALGVIFFGILQLSGTFADPDSFYHLKIAELIRKEFIVRDFPWLVFTDLPRIYTDHHFLYHLILAPFVYFSPFYGAKVLTAIINTIFLLFFYHFLKSARVPRIPLFIFLLLGAPSFVFRISLVKAAGLSLIFVILILMTMLSRRYVLLGLVSFFYVFAYGGWPMSIIFGGVFLLASILANLILLSPRESIKKSEWRPLLAAAFGSLAGLIFNPYFPQNLKFYWLQIVQIALVNYKTKIGVGAEWYNFDFFEIIIESGAIILVFLFGMFFFFGRIFKKNSLSLTYPAARDIFFYIISAGAMFVLTLKSRRNAEYFFPFAVLAGATLFKYFYDREIYWSLRKNFLIFLKKNYYLRIFGGLAIAMFFFSFGLNFFKIKKALDGGYPFNTYRSASEMIKKESAGGSIVFTSDWDDWPMLFYHNDRNRYIVGLDPTFMYKYNRGLFQKWRDITWGKFFGDVFPVIKNEFGAETIFIAKNDLEAMDKYFKNDGRFEIIYNKEDAKVYKLKN